MRVAHLYPFVPAGRHGGTLRLRAAVGGTASLGEPEIHWFDASAGSWRGPVGPEELDRLDPPSAPRPAGLKRALFPSTLWESGRVALRALGPHLDANPLEPRALVVAHTSYLAPALDLPQLRAAARLVDVYDLVWRAHRNDARAGGPARPVRAAYAQTVRAREPRRLRAADMALVAGWDDFEWLSALGAPPARWIPTPTPVAAVEPRRDRDGLHVGFIGNFSHAATFDSARRLLASPLGAGGAITLVFAGRGSRAAIQGRPGVEVLGELARAEDFYARIDCAVVPVASGSGIKCKLAEAVIAGRPVITTELGASGYPPALREQFTIGTPEELDRSALERAISGFDPLPARAALEAELGWDPVTRRYREAAEAALTPRGGRSSAIA